MKREWLTEMQFAGLIVSTNVQTVIMTVSILAVAAIWLTPATVIASLRDVAVSVLHGMAPARRADTLGDARAALARLFKAMLALAAPRASVAPQAAARLEVVAIAVQAEAAASKEAAATRQVATILGEARQWEMLCARIDERTSRTSTVRRLQDNASLQLDAAQYGLNRLAAELSAVMPGIATATNRRAVPAYRPARPVAFAVAA